MIKVSLFASAVRPQLWPAFFKSLESTSVKYEVVFAGNTPPESLPMGVFSYVPTKNIKPAQCYEIARRSCGGEVVVWIADDAECPNDVIGKAYKYWKSQNNEKLILSIQTRESGYNLPVGQLFDMSIHRFFGGYNSTPLMAPLGMMSRKFLEELGGFDRRFVCGQYENQTIMMAYERKAKVEIFGGPDCFIDIDHLGKSIAIGESKIEADFLNRPFAQGYKKDREVLENSWILNGKISPVMLDKFEPYEDTDILTKSQSNKGAWE